MLKPLQCDKPSNDCWSQTKYLLKPHQMDSEAAVWTCELLRKAVQKSCFQLDRWKKLSWLDPHSDSCRKDGQFLLIATVEEATSFNGGRF